MAAADSLALYLRSLDDQGRLPHDCDGRVLCEWQEDWVLLEGDDAELVSGKHRDPSVSAFTTVNKLADEGGLAHLFERWSVLDETPLCRLVTTGGIAAGDPQDVLAACDYFRQMRLSGVAITVTDDHRNVVDKLRESIARYHSAVKSRWKGTGGSAPVSKDKQCTEVARFLSMLRLDHGKPQRAHIEYAAPSMFAQPVLDRLAMSGRVAVVWEAVVRLFRARMRAKGPIPSAALPAVMAYRVGASVPTANDVERDLAARIVTMSDIDIAIRTALAMPAGYEPVQRVPLTTRLAVKMNTGGCSDNAVERAEHLRMEYQDYWRDRISGDALARVEQRGFERRLLRINDEANDSVSVAGGVLWRRLQQRMDELPSDSLPAGMDADLALGGLCEWANRCKVWFGQRFDVDAVIARLRAEREAAS
ncbi:hypothetical protein CLV43_119103 [Umezawaea tangerina]|uniref:Uncharacterized protein n=2 Tax=Umezawaea tangerina TaxID=84725 RepID=A0A2T0SK82_9PSEU|nr:hypothetical protein CLV43_119103 [Umezawaea tangerina]